MNRKNQLVRGKKLLFNSLLFLTVIFFVRCVSIHIPGKYRSKDGTYQLVLNDDSTFLFDYRFQFVYEYSSGLFKILDNKSIMLNSLIRNKLLPIRVKTANESQASADNILRVRFNFPENEIKYYKCRVFINGVVFRDSYCDSLSVLAVDKAVNNFSFGISADERMPGRFFDTLYTEVFTTSKSLQNNLSVEVVVKESLFNYRVFDNEIIKVSDRKLVILNDNRHLLLFREKNRKAR